jgi:hypothetical protein
MGYPAANTTMKKNDQNLVQRVWTEFKREVGVVKQAFETGETPTTRDRSTFTQDVYTPTPNDQFSDHFRDQDNWLKASRRFK